MLSAKAIEVSKPHHNSRTKPAVNHVELSLVQNRDNIKFHKVHDHFPDPVTSDQDSPDKNAITCTANEDLITVNRTYFLALRCISFFSCMKIHTSTHRGYFKIQLTLSNRALPIARVTTQN